MKVSRLEIVAAAPWFESNGLLRVGHLARLPTLKKPGDRKQGSDSDTFETRLFHDGRYHQSKNQSMHLLCDVIFSMMATARAEDLLAMLEIRAAV